MYVGFRLIAIAVFFTLAAAQAGAQVEPGSPQWERALKGRVIGPDGKGIAGASVKCLHVRTPGDGLITSVGQPVQTDAEGRFAIYPEDADKQRFNGRIGGGDLAPPHPKERGDLVPLNSKYHIEVDVPADDHFFAHQGDYANTEPVTIRLQRPEKRRTFKYESPDGGFMTEAQLQALYLYYQPSPREENRHLPPRYRAGGYLADGKYQAEVDRISYEPIQVTNESPAELIFRLPPPIHYRGSVVDGATGAPMAGVFVLGLESTAERSLSNLESTDWDKLEALKEPIAANDPALEPVRHAFGFHKIIRTDAEGHYDFLQTPAMGQTYGLVFFARNRLPILQRLYDTKPDAQHIAALADLPLYPAARVTLKIAPPAVDDHASSMPSAMPRWEFDQAARQPAWFAKLKQIDGGPRHWACDHWLPMRTTSVIYIPAETTLRLRLDLPYNDQWSPKEPDVVLKLAAGETKDIGEASFEASLKLTVRVLDPLGNPVEGAPIRRLDTARNCWSVVHNTDARGDAIFLVPPRSIGEFGIIDLPGMQGGAVPANLKLRYEIGPKLENDKPLLMHLTAEQIRALRGAKPAGAV